MYVYAAVPDLETALASFKSDAALCSCLASAYLLSKIGAEQRAQVGATLNVREWLVTWTSCSLTESFRNGALVLNGLLPHVPLSRVPPDPVQARAEAAAQQRGCAGGTGERGVPARPVRATRHHRPRAHRRGSLGREGNYSECPRVVPWAGCDGPIHAFSVASSRPVALFAPLQASTCCSAFS